MNMSSYAVHATFDRGSDASPSVLPIALKDEFVDDEAAKSELAPLTRLDLLVNLDSIFRQQDRYFVLVDGLNKMNTV